MVFHRHVDGHGYAVGMHPHKKHPCPCCGRPTLTEAPPGTFAICPGCGWEDDPVQAADPGYAGGANRDSLKAAREAYKLRSGASGITPAT